MITTASKRGRLALMVAHCAGMVDLVALPVWVGILMAHDRFDPQQAGGLATLLRAFAVVMGVAAVTVLLAFPQVDAPAAAATTVATTAPFPRAVWFGIVGIGCMGLVQAMTSPPSSASALRADSRPRLWRRCSSRD